MSRGRWLALIGVLCAGGAVGYLALAALDPSPVTTKARPAGATGPPTGLAGSRLMVRAVARKDPALNGHLFAIKRGRARALGGDLACARVHFAAGRGLCLSTAPSGVSYEATIFDADLEPVERLSLAGLPSRARVSPNGRYGAMTVFVNGHEYLGAGGFSTRTSIVDMRDGGELGELEEFDVFRGGRRLESPDFNFWGITFAADPDRFYATLRTGGRHYLVEGSVSRRRLRVLREGVECPSLSPDGSRIAFKSRIPGEDLWRLAVLDVATLADHPVGERRSIDDQPEWFDEHTLVYSDGFDVFTVAADGSGSPRRVLRDATSPVSLESEPIVEG